MNRRLASIPKAPGALSLSSEALLIMGRQFYARAFASLHFIAVITNYVERRIHQVGFHGQLVLAVAYTQQCFKPSAELFQVRQVM